MYVLIAWRTHPDDLKKNLEHLILAVNTCIPPLRLNFLDMKVWRDKAEPRIDEQPNYLWEKESGHWGPLFINSDKVETRRKNKGLARQVMDLNADRPGITDGRKLGEIITQSLEAAPREYVLVGLRNSGSMAATTYDKLLAVSLLITMAQCPDSFSQR